jgi:hypothetical protein
MQIALEMTPSKKIWPLSCVLLVEFPVLLGPFDSHLLLFVQLYPL